MEPALPRSRLLALRSAYWDGLLKDTAPFWLRHGLDADHGGVLSALDQDGTVIDTDKSVWAQGRVAWMYGTLYGTVERRPEWLAAAQSCLAFLRNHCEGPEGKLYFWVTREGHPLRMRRYVYSECFAAMAAAIIAKVTGEARAAEDAVRYFATFLLHTFTPGVMPPKTDPATRPMIGSADLMITVAVAQELRACLGDVEVGGSSCTAWIDRSIDDVRRYFYKPESKVMLEIAAPDGSLIDHFEGRTVNPGHAIECSWFILHEAKLRRRDPALLQLGLGILDCMWERGWDREYGGLLYFRDVRGLPVQEYWAEMKFWWPHNEAVIATLLAYQLTGDPKYVAWHTLAHDWTHRVFPDPKFGEWFGYAQRDGTIVKRLKGNLWKSFFHVPRMQWYCARLVDELLAADGGAPRNG